MRLPTPSTDNTPDNFWNWRVLDIDEQRFEELERVRQGETGSWWPVILGVVMGILLLIITA